MASPKAPRIPAALPAQLLLTRRLPCPLAASCLLSWPPWQDWTPQRAACPTGLDPQENLIQYRLSSNEGEDCFLLAVCQLGSLLMGKGISSGPSRTAVKQLSFGGRQTWDSWAGTGSLEQALLGSLWRSDRLVLIGGELPASQGPWSGAASSSGTTEALQGLSQASREQSLCTRPFKPL